MHGNSEPMISLPLIRGYVCFPRSQTDGEGTENPDGGSGGTGGDVSFNKTSQLSIEDLSGGRALTPQAPSLL